MNTQARAEWYVKKGIRVQGPFTPYEIARFMLIGRIRATDRVSWDGETWEPVTQVPEMVPEELLDVRYAFKPESSPEPEPEPFKIQINMPAPKWWHFSGLEAVMWALAIFLLGWISLWAVVL